MRLARPRENRLEVNMTPMIDIVFLLIIFFMTVNQISDQTNEPLELSKQPGSQDQSQGAMTINIDAAGQIVVAGETLSVIDLAAAVSGEVERANNDPAAVTVIVRADRRGDCRSFNQVVGILARLDVSRVRFAVESSP
ncbi:MAG: biopolymer transporter ExbD [Pirellulaceae bacterium]|jgi:biopolymer transport protein ExbD|nr:biopolymer transporter ExbD [Pirellulaceae bacterium]